MLEYVRWVAATQARQAAAPQAIVPRLADAVSASDLGDATRASIPRPTIKPLPAAAIALTIMPSAEDHPSTASRWKRPSIRSQRGFIKTPLDHFNQFAEAKGRLAAG